MKRILLIYTEPTYLTRVYAGTGGDVSAVQRGHNIYYWGYNTYGNLGDNTTINKCLPTSILGVKKIFYKIASGLYHSSSIDNFGQAWGWGYNYSGIIGNNSTISKRTPVSVHGSKKTFCEISCGINHTTSLDFYGQIWAWGNNAYGQLGNNSTTSRRTPVSILGSKKTFCKIVNGTTNTFGIDKYGQIWGWGTNTDGKLGDGSTISKSTPVSILGAKKTFCQISAAERHTVGIDVHGQIWCWGNNSYGALGNNESTARCTPVSLLGSKKTFCKISTGAYFTIALDYNGQMWSWGYNTYGQLGDQTTLNKCTPTSIIGAKKTFCYISTGNNHTLAVEHTGRIWSYGFNSYGQLGNFDTDPTYTPKSIKGTKKTFCSVSTGEYHSMGLYNGQIYTWGRNNFGQLGNNSTISDYTPISILGAKKTFCKISGGILASSSIDYNGQAWGWGYNIFGQIGDSTNTHRSTPVSVRGAKKTFCHISSGKNKTLGIDKYGQMWCWGYNNKGQLGDNSVTSRRTPVSLLGAKKTFCSIISTDIGLETSISIDNQGQVWSWGANAYGNLGDNTTTSRRTPVSLLGAKKTFCKITQGLYSTLAIDYNGQVWGWGLNTSYQLGDFYITSRLTPVSLYGAKKTFCEITGGYQASFGLDYKGQVWAWGTGILGTGPTATQRCTPISILGFKKTFCKISSGYYHVLALDYNGDTWAWGFNIYGQNGQFFAATTPIRVCNF